MIVTAVLVLVVAPIYGVALHRDMQRADARRRAREAYRARLRRVGLTPERLRLLEQAFVQMGQQFARAMDPIGEAAKRAGKALAAARRAGRT